MWLEIMNLGCQRIEDQQAIPHLVHYQPCCNLDFQASRAWARGIPFPADFTKKRRKHQGKFGLRPSDRIPGDRHRWLAFRDFSLRIGRPVPPRPARLAGSAGKATLGPVWQVAVHFQLEEKTAEGGPAGPSLTGRAELAIAHPGWGQAWLGGPS